MTLNDVIVTHSSANKDQYARAECSKKFFFTIELCEFIELDRIEIASYELFTSRVKDFEIRAADAEKRSWVDLGTFQAAKFTAKTNIQSFGISDEFRDFRVKYIRFDMLSHQGDEPLCTLTWFGVFGWGEYNPLPDEDEPARQPDIEDNKAPQAKVDQNFIPFLAT